MIKKSIFLLFAVGFVCDKLRSATEEELKNRGLEFIDALKSNNIIKAKNLLSEGINVNSQDANGNTPLIYAAGQGHNDLVQELIKAEGIDINLANNAGNTALAYAVAAGQEEAVRLLIEAHADVNKANKRNETPLSQAKDRSWMGKNYEGIIELLKNAGAK